MTLPTWRLLRVSMVMQYHYSCMFEEEKVFLSCGQRSLGLWLFWSSTDPWPSLECKRFKTRYTWIGNIITYKCIRTPQVPSKVRYQKTKPNFIYFPQLFNHIFLHMSRNIVYSVYSMKSMFWTNEKLFLMVAWSSSVSISRFKVQSSKGHLVWFLNSGNSIVSGANLWCPCRVYVYCTPITMYRCYISRDQI